MKNLLLRPSNADRWTGCPASIIKGCIHYMRTTTNSAAEEGTRMHDLAHQALLGQTVKLPPHVKLYVDHVRGIVEKTGGIPHFEKTVAFPSIHKDLSPGTADFFLYDENGKTVYVRDYKNGRGIVDEHTFQLLVYAVGVFDEFGIDWDDAEIQVDVGIVQPNADHPDGPIRTYRLTATELKEAAAYMGQMVGEALSTNPRAMTGQHCKYCLSAGDCNALKKSTHTLIDFITNWEPERQDDAELAEEIKLLRYGSELLKTRIAAKEAVAMSKLRAGELIPGYTVKNVPGRLTWDCDDATLRQLEKEYGVTLFDKPVTPTQAKRLLGADVVSKLSKPGKSFSKLVETSKTPFKKVGK